MTVKSLSDYQKSEIAFQFVYQNWTLNSLAKEYGRSRRTIIRSLEDKEIDPGVKHRAPKLITEQKSIPFDYLNGCSPNAVIHRTHTPWYRRVIDSVSRVFT